MDFPNMNNTFCLKSESLRGEEFPVGPVMSVYLRLLISPSLPVSHSHAVYNQDLAF